MVFGDGQSNIVIQIYSELSLVAIATKFGTKWAVTRLLLEICARSLRLYRGVFGVGPCNTVNKILPRLILVAMATKFETKNLTAR